MKPHCASLLLLCCCCLGRGVARTWPWSPQREAAALRESLNRHRYLNSFSHENATAFYGVNQFSYLFPEEFKALYLGSKPAWAPRYPAKGQTPIPNVSLPLRFDWRDKHVVNHVRNQKMCGGCWAFSVVSAIESAGAIQGKPLDYLSVQQVIDCSFNNYGCRGGSPLGALRWLNETQLKLVADSQYPFKAENGLCRYFPPSQSGVSVKGFSSYDFRINDFVEGTLAHSQFRTNFLLKSSTDGHSGVSKKAINENSNQEDEMARALLSFGPLVVIVDAVSWQDYLGGIIQHHCSSQEPNHAVLITGFDKTGNTPYWMVRNSWGNSWGVEGYAHVKMGGNVCGIADSVAAVFV